jgi:hypothetical protein
MRKAGPAPSSSIAIDDALSRTRLTHYEAGLDDGDKFILLRKSQISAVS